MIISLMNGARYILINSVLGGPLAVINGFEVGTDVNFIPDPAGVGATPTPIVYSATYPQIYKTIVTNDEVIITCYIPYNVAVSIGNIMIKLINNVPFLWMAFPTLYQKQAINNAEHYAGDIYQIPFVLRYPSITSRIDFTNIADYYALAPTVQDYSTMNSVFTNNCDEQLVQKSTYTENLGRPYYAQRIGTKWWGTPFAMNLFDVRPWGIYGGVTGDAYTYTFIPNPYGTADFSNPYNSDLVGAIL